MMKNKRVFSVLFALGLIMIADSATYKGYDATKTPMVNTDLMVLTMSSFKQINQQMQQPTHNRNSHK